MKTIYVKRKRSNKRLKGRFLEDQLQRTPMLTSSARTRQHRASMKTIYIKRKRSNKRLKVDIFKTIEVRCCPVPHELDSFRVRSNTRQRITNFRNFVNLSHFSSFWKISCSEPRCWLVPHELDNIGLQWKRSMSIESAQTNDSKRTSSKPSKCDVA